MKEEDLVSWIKENMTVDGMSVIERNKETISKFIGITPTGEPILLVDKKGLKGRQAVMLHLIGKYMAWLAEYTADGCSKNSDIVRSLGMPKGTVGRCLRELEGAGLIAGCTDGGYAIVLSSLSTFFADLRGH